MTPIESFAAYAAAFERVVETDDFSHIEPYFTEDAVYETFGGPPFEGRHEGREEVFAYLKASLDSFDRRFDTRALELLEGPEERGDVVWLRWRAVYTKAGLPDLAIEGEETVVFEDERIRRMVDRFTPETAKQAAQYFATHAEALGVPPQKDA